VNAVCPGLIESPLTTEVDHQLASLMHQEVDDLARTRRTSVPLGRGGAPDEVADAVSFLVGSRSSYITGQALHVNGGAVMTS
jgi:NAD(P)-dependent dehydrogenase (short-subunit alcohol dehydrogenase family)